MTSYSYVVKRVIFKDILIILYSLKIFKLICFVQYIYLNAYTNPGLKLHLSALPLT